jgi:hypothetical protein
MNMTRKDVATLNAETVTKATEAEPHVEQVRSRAYEIYCERCEDGRAGDALTDWAAAERELTTGASGGYATALVGAAAERSGT